MNILYNLGKGKSKITYYNELIFTDTQENQQYLL